MDTVRATRVLGISGTRLTLDDAPFAFQGMSFFNAIYNPSFNESVESRMAYLLSFRETGISALRIWCQWDFDRPFVDLAPDHTTYTAQGDVRDKRFRTLAEILQAADSLSIAIELTLFSHEKQPNMLVPAQERAAREMARLLRPYRNLVLQIWNEDSIEVARHYEAIKAVDAERIVTNSPGFAGDLGDDAQNRTLDLLTPHTARAGAKPFWQVAPQQIARLLERYEKPVIDDEPARTGLVRFGGIEGGTRPEQHIEQIRRVRAAGGYHTYHHDMFQNGYGHPATPACGVPDPHHPFHEQVFAFLRANREW